MGVTPAEGAVHSMGQPLAGPCCVVRAGERRLLTFMGGPIYEKNS